MMKRYDAIKKIVETVDDEFIISNIGFPSREGEKVVPRFELFNDMGHIDELKAEKLHFEK